MVSFNFTYTKFGVKLLPRLPVTIDSLIGIARTTLESEELHAKSFYIAKPTGAYGSLLRRTYHAWLVLTNRAMAVQFSRDHFEMANVKGLELIPPVLAKTTSEKFVFRLR